MPEDAKVLKLYMVKDEYITDLHDNVDEHVFANIDPRYNHSRKYLGALLVINGFFYYAPLSSPKNSDYMIMRGRRVIRNSTKSIIRMVETDEHGKRSLLGTIKLSNMIPVPSSQLIDYDLDNEQDVNYKDLVLKEKRFINRNEEMITSYAEVLYREKLDDSISKGYLNATFDFTAFEKYITSKYLTDDIEGAVAQSVKKRFVRQPSFCERKRSSDSVWGWIASVAIRHDACLKGISCSNKY